jgi:cell wall-associated NlpC family hydrolase
MRGKMILKRNYTARFGIIFILILGLLFINFNDTFAKKKKRSKPKRSYNRTATKNMSMNILRHNSELADMANLPLLDSTLGEVTLDENNQIIGELGEDLAELEAEDDFTYDAENFQMLWMSVSDDEYTLAGISKSEILSNSMDLFGTPYRFGGVSTRGLDCSAFTRLIFYKVAGIEIPRTAREQVNIGAKIKKIGELQFGDLIFFHTYSRRFASHVGIYLGDGLFVHSGTRYGVSIASLTSQYYNKRFIGGRRLTEKDINKYKVKDIEENIDLKAAM